MISWYVTSIVLKYLGVGVIAYGIKEVMVKVCSQYRVVKKVDDDQDENSVYSIKEPRARRK